MNINYKIKKEIKRLKNKYEMKKKYKYYLEKAKENKMIFINELETSNIGDLSCSVNEYFFKGDKDIVRIPINYIVKGFYVENKTIIVGGGGLIREKTFRKNMKVIHSLSKRNKIILWGIGTDVTPYEKEIEISYINDFNLIGLRDYKYKNYQWVPCPSCMSKNFDKSINEIDKKVVAYLHADLSYDIKEQLSNYQLYTNKENTFEKTIQILGSSDIILTNSYHGAYWGTLLGKKVVIIPCKDKKGYQFIPRKMRMYKHQPVICEHLDDLSKYIEKSISYPNALFECRTKNIEFYNNVLELIR